MRAAILSGVPAQKHPRAAFRRSRPPPRSGATPLEPPAGANTRPSGYTGPVTVRDTSFSTFAPRAPQFLAPPPCFRVQHNFRSNFPIRIINMILLIRLCIIRRSKRGNKKKIIGDNWRYVRK